MDRYHYVSDVIVKIHRACFFFKFVLLRFSVGMMRVVTMTVDATESNLCCFVWTQKRKKDGGRLISIPILYKKKVVAGIAAATANSCILLFVTYLIFFRSNLYIHFFLVKSKHLVYLLSLFVNMSCLMVFFYC